MKVKINYPQAYGNLVRWHLIDANNLASLSDVEYASETIEHTLLISDGVLIIKVYNKQDADAILSWSRPDYITLKQLQQWFIDDKISEEEADERIKFFYVYNEDDRRIPEVLYEQDWCFNVVRQSVNKFTDCKTAQEWCHIMNRRYMSRNPYIVKLVINKKSEDTTNK